MELSLTTVDRLLRSPTPSVSGRVALGFAVVLGLVHGAAVGTYTGVWAGEPIQLVYSAVKLPMLLIVTFAIALPSFFVLNVLAGVGDDFRQALRNLLAAQAVICVTLVSLAPALILWYAGNADYAPAVLANAAIFLAAALVGQWVLRRWYRPLEQRVPIHRLLRRVWLVLYAFVGMQMGYVLRPFIGSPGKAPTFFREEAWGNAYLVIVRLVGESLGLG
ncbi:MAG: hypothetical protein AAF743_03420 [Planctomycetota bacterium]